MKLHWAPTSPYVRKVMIAAHELGVADRIETLETTPATVLDDVAADNPLAMIPTLVTDDGEVLYDSWVIICWLDQTFGGALVPTHGPGAWPVHRRHALAHGLIDAANRWINECRRPQELYWQEAIARLSRRVELGLDGLERDVKELSGPVAVDQIAAGVALAYIDYRFPEISWRDTRSALADWYAEFAARPSMKATVPPDQPPH